MIHKNRHKFDSNAFCSLMSRKLLKIILETVKANPKKHVDWTTRSSHVCRIVRLTAAHFCCMAIFSSFAKKSSRLKNWTKTWKGAKKLIFNLISKVSLCVCAKVAMARDLNVWLSCFLEWCNNFHREHYNRFVRAKQARKEKFRAHEPIRFFDSQVTPFIVVKFQPAAKARYFVDFRKISSAVATNPSV